MADGYLDLPGGSGNYADTPDHADFDITGDIDIRADVAMADWTPSATNEFVGKRHTTSNQRSYGFSIIAGGQLQWSWSTAGVSLLTATSSAATGFTDGTRHWVRVTMDVDDGAGNRVIKFYTSSDGSSWTQLGSTVTTAGTTSIFSGSALPALGAANGGTSSVLTGKIYRVKLYASINEANLKCSLDLTTNTGGNTQTDPEGHVWTERGTGNFVAEVIPETHSGSTVMSLGLSLPVSTSSDRAGSAVMPSGLVLPSNATGDRAGATAAEVVTAAPVSALTDRSGPTQADIVASTAADVSTDRSGTTELIASGATDIVTDITTDRPAETQINLAVLALLDVLAERAGSALLETLTTPTTAGRGDRKGSASTALAPSPTTDGAKATGHSTRARAFVTIPVEGMNTAHIPVPVNVRFRTRARTTSMRVRAKTTTMRFGVRGDRIKVIP